MDGQSKNLTQEYIKQLQTIFPEAVTEVADKDGNNTSLKVDMEKHPYPKMIQITSRSMKKSSLLSGLANVGL